jgi:transposase
MPRVKTGVKKGPRMISEIQRLKGMGIGKTKIAAALGVSKNTVRKYLRVEVSSQTVCSKDLRAPTKTVSYHAPWANQVDWNKVRFDINRGVQLKHHWEEWIACPAACERLGVRIPYESFWREYKRQFPLIPIDFHKHHPPGEKCEVDYKGDSHGLRFFDLRTNMFVDCRLFGSILCFSQLFFAKATLTEQQSDLLSGIADSFAYFGGVPHTTMVDNAKASVYRAHRYDPDINPEFAKFCEHYGTAELAARPRSPKDKNLIENVLGVFWRWAGPKMRERKFFSLAELNEYLLILINDFNNRTQRKYQASRLQRFLETEKEKLLGLPETVYEAAQWKKLVVHPDSHLQVNNNFYSAPYQLRGQQLDVRISPTYIEIFHCLERVAVHLTWPSNQQGRYRTDEKHLPESHVAMLEFTPRKAIEDAKAIGPSTHQIVFALFTQSRHPLMYLRRIQGILRLKNRYSAQDLEGACAKLYIFGITSFRIHEVEQLIKLHRKSGIPLEPKPAIRSQNNQNLRGQSSWQLFPTEENQIKTQERT